VKVIKLSKPAAEVLPLMKEFPSAQTSEGAEHAAHEQGTITEAAKEAKAPAADESAKREAAKRLGLTREQIALALMEVKSPLQ
jgi:hypothetical protein